MFAPSVGTMMNGEHAFATSGGNAWRRRQRRLRAFRRLVLWHSKMEVAAALHHTSGRRTSTTPQFSSTAVEPIAPRVVDPLPPIEEFTGPVYDQVHQEQFTAGEMPENLVEIPVVQEQVIVQAIPEVVDSLPPVEEFTGPGFNHVHHEHIAAVPAVTEFFPMSDDESGELSAGVRPAPLDEGRPQGKVQRRTVEQLVDATPCLPVLDAPVPLVAEQLVDVLSLVAKHDMEMDRLEDRILQGSPVSVAEKEAWRRWASRGGEFSSRKMKKRKKKKLPRGYSQCKTVQKTEKTPQEQGCDRRSCTDKFQQFVVLGAVQSVHRQSTDFPLCAETCALSKNCAADRCDSSGAALGPGCVHACCSGPDRAARGGPTVAVLGQV